MMVNQSQSESAARELGNASETEQAAPCLESYGFDPALNEPLKLVAEEMMRELEEECDRKERARAGIIETPSINVNRSENVENEQVDDSGVAGMRVDNRYYLTVMLGRQEYKALFDSGATLSLVGPRVTEVLKDRLKEYDSVIRFPVLRRSADRSAHPDTNGAASDSLAMPKCILSMVECV